MKNFPKFHLSTPGIRRALACLLIFALVVTLAPVQSLAQTVQREKTVAEQLPDTAVYHVGDCTVTYDTLLQEGLSPDIHIAITNHGQKPITKWQLRFPYSHIINPSSDIRLGSRQNGYYTFTPTLENTEIASGQTVAFSFSVKGETVPEAPEEIEFVINDEDFAPLPTPIPAATSAKSMATATTTLDAPVTVNATAAPTGHTKTTAAATAMPTHLPAVTATPDTVPLPAIRTTPQTTTMPTAPATPQATTMPTAPATPQPTQTTPATQPTAGPVSGADAGLAGPPAETTPGPSQQPAAVSMETTQPAEDLYIYTDTTIREDTTCGNLFLMGGNLTIDGATLIVQGDYFQNGGTSRLNNAQLAVGRNLSLQNGTMQFLQNDTADIHGDLRLEGGGKLDISHYRTPPRLTVHGDLIINSTGQSDFQDGSLTLMGDLIQQDSGYADSLRVGDNFQIQFAGTAIQTIRLANPGTKLGTIDLRKSEGINLSHELHGFTLYGFHKIQAGQSMEFHLATVVLGEDDTIHSTNVKWCGGSLQADGCTMCFEGNLEIAENGYLRMCGGELSVAKNLAVTDGTLGLDHQAKADIQGDLRLGQKGKLDATNYLACPQITVRGNILINSKKQSCLENGSLTLGGNLIQQDSGYADSLCVGDNFQIHFNGTAIQTIRLANPGTKLGILEFRESTGICLPAEIHACTIHGFHKIQAGPSQEFHLATAILEQDDTIHSTDVKWCGGGLDTNGHNLCFAGGLEISRNGGIHVRQGSLSIGGTLNITDGTLGLDRQAKADIQGGLHLGQKGKLDLSYYSAIPELTVHGDLIINSTKQSCLENGSLTLGGNLIQQDSGYADSLRVGDNFQIHFDGTAIQTIRMANPGTKLGTLEFRKSTGIRLPAEIHAHTIHGFQKIQAGPSQEFHLATAILEQDDTIHSTDVKWCGGGLDTNGHNLCFAGALEISRNGGIHVRQGSLSIGGSLTATDGTLGLDRQAKADIQGDLCLGQKGKLDLSYYLAIPELTVHGDLIINSTKQSYLENGTLTLGGSFLQTEDTQTENLRIGSEFTLILNGAATQTIDIPGVEKITQLDLSQSTAVCLASELSGTYLTGVEKLTSGGETIYLDFSHATTTGSGTIRGSLKCFGDLTVDGHVLTIQGKYTQYGNTIIHDRGTLTTTGDFTAGKGKTDIRDGLFDVQGTAHIKKNAAINMKQPDTCRFLAEGDYISASRSTDQWGYNEGGTFEIKGNLTQRDTALTLGLNLETTTVLFSGTVPQNVKTPYFRTFGYAGCIDLRKSKEVNFGPSALHARQIIGFSHIRVSGDLTLNDSRVTLIQDETYDGNINLNHTYLDLNGYTFQTRSQGSIEQNGGLTNLDGGTLCIGGNYHLEGSSILQMIRPEDLLQVKGSFSTASTMSHATMLRDGRFELWGNFNQSGAVASFDASGSFTTAFLGSDQHAHFDDDTYHDFGNVDPEFGGITMDDKPIVFMVRLNYHFSKGFLEGLRDALGISELNGTTMAILAALGISAAALTAIGYGTIVAVIGIIADIFTIISSAFMIARAMGGIYSTTTGNDTIYNKAEAFAHDTAVMMVGSLFITAGLVNFAKIYSACKSAAGVTAEATSPAKPSEVIKTLKKIECISSFEDFLEIVKTFLEDDALQFIRTAMKGDADDLACLKKVAELFEKASKNIGKTLSRGEVEAGLEEWWRSGRAEKALAAVERVFKWESKGISYAEYKNLCQKSVHNPGKDKVMLGKYDGGGETSYITKAGKDYTYFDLGGEWNVLEERYGFSDRDLFELFNEPFLEDGISQGKVFYFSHNPVGDAGALGGEYRYLLANGYKWDPITMTMK